MTMPTISPRPVWPIRAGLAGAIVAAAAIVAVWLAGGGLDVEASDGWLLIGAGATGWLGATVAGCFGPLPTGTTRNVVLDGAMLLSTVSIVVLAAGVAAAAAGLR